MGTRRVAFIGVLLSSSLAGCAATTTTSKVAVDYNRIFAKSRDEVLVTNILRASAREPLQFSTMGTVTGGVRNGGAIKLALPSLIGAGPTILSPEFTVNEGINPNINIIPLSNKEFTEGMLKPVSTETVNFFLNQGWDPEFILTLVVGGVICSKDRVVLNRGVRGSTYDAFAAMFADVPRRPLRPKGPDIKYATVRMPSKEAVAFLTTGVGKGRKIAGLGPVLDGNGQSTGDVEVSIVSAQELELTGLDTSSVCPKAAEPAWQANQGDPKPADKSEETTQAMDTNAREEGRVAIAGKGQRQAMLRSVEAIIYFLGETHRARSETACGVPSQNDGWPYYTRKQSPLTITLLHLDKACSGGPVAFRTFMQTKFNDGTYYVRRFGDAPPADRTLTTLSFLNELIALQTSESSVVSATPVVAIGTR